MLKIITDKGCQTYFYVKEEDNYIIYRGHTLLFTSIELPTFDIEGNKLVIYASNFFNKFRVTLDLENPFFFIAEAVNSNLEVNLSTLIFSAG